MHIAPVHTTTTPVIFKSLSVKKVGSYSMNSKPILTKKRLFPEPLKDDEEIDTTVYEIDIVDDNGIRNVYTLVVPNVEEDGART